MKPSKVEFNLGLLRDGKELKLVRTISKNGIRWDLSLEPGTNCIPGLTPDLLKAMLEAMETVKDL